MIYLTLFLTFLKVGAVSFGGGYGMISLIREEVLANGWLTEDKFLSFIAVSESTPGPLAVNMATFIGSSQGGALGAFLATLGVVLPSLVIILIIASVFANLLKFAPVNYALKGVRPVVAGLIFGTAVTLLLPQLLGVSGILSLDEATFQWQNAVIFALIVAVAFGYKRIFKKSISPILLILFSAVLGILFFVW